MILVAFVKLFVITELFFQNVLYIEQDGPNMLRKSKNQNTIYTR